eukprot:170185_1
MKTVIPWGKKITTLKIENRRTHFCSLTCKTMLVKWQILTSDNEPHLIALIHSQDHDGISYKTCSYKRLLIDGFENNSGKTSAFKLERRIGNDIIGVFTEFVYVTNQAPKMTFMEKNEKKCFKIWRSRYMFMLNGYTRQSQQLLNGQIIPCVVNDLLYEFVVDVWEFELIEEYAYRLTINGMNYSDACSKWKAKNN